jgi:phospholipid N-methyltransferase
MDMYGVDGVMSPLSLLLLANERRVKMLYDVLQQVPEERMSMFKDDKNYY